jgi:hypothetical protein
MRLDDRTAYALIILAERGLKIHSFDGYTLRLSYNAAADTEAEAGRTVCISELAKYAANMLNQMPDAIRMFPGLDHIKVSAGESGTNPGGDLRSSTVAPHRD